MRSHTYGANKFQLILHPEGKTCPKNHVTRKHSWMHWNFKILRNAIGLEFPWRQALLHCEPLFGLNFIQPLLDRLFETVRSGWRTALQTIVEDPKEANSPLRRLPVNYQVPSVVCLFFVSFFASGPSPSWRIERIQFGVKQTVKRWEVFWRVNSRKWSIG